MTQKELTNLLDEASKLYYDGKESPLTDTEFDLKLKELQRMEKESGEVYPNSPTLRVGSDIQKEFKKIEHPRPMLTIENTYDDEGLDDWKKKIEEKVGKKLKYNVSVKYDGISCEIHYKRGVYVSAATRGDKMIGDDITENVKTIKDVPMYIKSISTIPDFYVRGEVLMPKSQLDRVNEERVNNGETPFRNTRNACSGSLKQLDPKVTASRGLIFRAWDCFNLPYITSYGDFPWEFETMEEKMDALIKMGFKFEYFPTTFNSDCNLSEAINEEKKTIDSLNLDYDYDGVVIKINNCYIQDCVIGTTDTRAIGWGIARKWNEEYEVETELVGVDWQVGRTGVVTPVGRLSPVECGGVTISNVTLNNIDFITSLDLKIGKTLKITRSGGVIPYVLGCSCDINGIYPEIEIPKVCPVCGEPLVMDGARLKCVNEECPAIVKGKILQFCSKEGMDIRTIGESVVDDLVGKLEINSIDKLYGLTYKDANNLAINLGDGYGEQKCKKIIDSINESKKQPFERVLASVSIPGVGKTTARLLAKKFHNYDAIRSANIEDLMEIDGVGETMAKDIFDWVDNRKNDDMMFNLYMNGVQLGINMEEDKTSEEDKPLEGLTVCFTGKSNRFSGDAIEDFLTENGAKCTHSVSKSMNYLITGEKPGGSKVEKATNLGVEIINEEEFFNKFNLI